MNYPDINNNSNYVEASPNKSRDRQALNSLDRSQQAQISQGIQIRDSYKEQQQQIQNQIKRRPQTSGNNNQIAYPPGV